MAARKKRARSRGRRSADAGGERLWPAMLGVFALRVFAGAIFLAVAHHKLIDRDLSLSDRIELFAEVDLVQQVEKTVANPPEVLGWRLDWYSDLLAAVVLPGKAPYVFAAVIMFFEALLGIALVLGLCTRLMAVLGALLMLAFGLAKSLPLLTVQGSNWYLVMILLALALTAAGRIWGLDARLRHKLPRWIA